MMPVYQLLGLGRFCSPLDSTGSWWTETSAILRDPTLEIVRGQHYMANVDRHTLDSGRTGSMANRRQGPLTFPDALTELSVHPRPDDLLQLVYQAPAFMVHG